tara:strand:- start:549 stop:821 length:273 start_codon:yes stop_codon:yes gene_type:complete
MTEFNELVAEVKLRIEAEKWAKGVSGLHAHSLNSMWYDDRPGDTANGQSVCDIEFNDGSIERTISATGEKVMMGIKMTQEELYDAYGKQA